jgi:hypothetical protein
MVNGGSGPVNPFSAIKTAGIAALFVYWGWFQANTLASLQWFDVSLISWAVLALGIGLGLLLIVLSVVYPASRGRSWLARRLSVILAAYILVVHVRAVAVERIQVFGESMLPALRHGDRLWINKIANGYRSAGVVFPMGPIL